MFEYLPNPYDQQTMYPCSNAQTRPKNGFTPVPDGTQTQSYINPRRNVDIWDKQLYLTPEERERCGLPPEDEPQVQVNNAPVQVNNAQVLPENAPQMQVNNAPQESLEQDDSLKIGRFLTNAIMGWPNAQMFDEVQGGLNAVGYGLTNAGIRAGRALGADWQEPQEGVWDAMKRGYEQGRGAGTREIGNALKQLIPSEETLRKGEQVTSAMMNGLTQGYEDEIEGGLKAVGYGLANAGMRAGRALGADWQVPQEGVWDAMKRGYVQGRDARRQVLNDAYEEMPIISTGMETIGSIASPANKLFGWQRGANPMAPRSMRIKANRNTVWGTSGINALGNSDDFSVGELGLNFGISSAGNFAGYALSNGLLGRFGNDFARAVFSGGVAQPIQSGLTYVKNHW